MEAVIDFLAEEELKAAEQFVRQAFDVKQPKQVRSVVEDRKAGKHERMGELVKDIRAKAAKAGR